MAFWLAKQSDGQQTDWIQRFDPRYWTVNFPRPMMASVIATGADSLEVNCQFQFTDDLAGLIWESEDRHDHPLLAYATDADYSRTILRFRWQSEGILHLDAANGPTLTIEGRDESGQPRSWYVRLWNYASGNTNNAVITLPFAELQSGWDISAGGEPVNAAAIDRMFISIVSHAYNPARHDRTANKNYAKVTLSEIRCEGYRPMLKIGDVMIPPHDIKMATAYDDSYHLTPQRMLRNIRGLGYRDRIVHYVGMSHFPLLDHWSSTGPLWVGGAGSICQPARLWHESFCNLCADMGYQPIFSLSFELLDEYCPSWRKQLANNGEIAKTGWEPPSTLLSPASQGAKDWLRNVAVEFAGLQQSAGLPVLFQIGEPWFWVTQEGRPCIYDAAMQSRLPAHAPIADIAGPLDAAQITALDTAGSILAEATAYVADGVRAAAGGEAEILLLSFTPQIFPPDRPELHRANMPIEWAAPAFDRLQLEDYDWLTGGAEALRKAAYARVQDRLSYPMAQQDYLAGFVLLPEDADRFWPVIDAALDEAEERGIEDRYVWAYPQIMRDGYTRLPRSKDDDMQAFDDVPYPLALGRDTAVSPEFSTTVAVTASGHERRASLWSDARLRFDVGPGIRSEKELGTLISFFRARRGPARGFRIADPYDFSSNGMTGTPTMLDQLIGTGDGLKASFPLLKHYGEGGDGGDPQLRPITRPRPETIKVSVDGVLASDWTFAGGGTITFASAPPEGAMIRAGFLFDVPVRFAEDRLDITGAHFAAGDAPSVPLIEIREVV